MKKFICMLMVTLILSPYVVFADTSIVSPTIQENLNSAQKTLGSLGTDMPFMQQTSNVIDVNGTAGNIWNYYIVIRDSYLSLITMEDGDPNFEIVVNDITNATSLISDKSRNTLTSESIENELDKISVNSLKSALEMITKDGEDGTYSKTKEDFKAGMSTLEDAKKVTNALLSSTIPSMYTTSLLIIDGGNMWEDASSFDGLNLIKSSLGTIASFNTKYGVEPNVIEDEDKVNVDIIQDLLNNKYSSKFKDIGATESNKINDEFSKAGVSEQAFDFAHERVAFVKRLSNEDIASKLNKKDIDLEDLTGPDIWAILEGGDARIHSSSKGSWNSWAGTYIEGPGLQSAYLAMFASTAVYEPFHSKLGDEDYMEALMSLVPKEQHKELKDLFSMISQYRKPLYFYTDKKTVASSTKLGMSYQTYNGSSQRLLLSDIISAVQGKKSLVAVTAKGKLIEDGDAWVYYNKELVTVGDAVSLAESKIEDSGTIAGVGDKYTRAVLEINQTMNDPDPGTLTAQLIKNCFEDEYQKAYWDSRGHEQVFLDAFGNIILQDATIILPASANPTYFAMPFNEHSGSWWYNPFTVAYFNSYPVIYGSETSPAIQTKKDKHKWVLDYEDPTQVSEFTSLGSGYTNVLNPFGLDRLLTTGAIGQSSDAVIDEFKTIVMPLYGQDVWFTKPGDRGSFMWSESFGHNNYLYPLFAFSDSTNNNNITSNIFVEVMKGQISVGDKEEAIKSGFNAYPLRLKPIRDGALQIFPYVSPNRNKSEPTESSQSALDYTAAKRIAQNMYMYLTDETQTAVDVPVGNGLLREGYMYTNIVCSVLDGMITPVAYSKSVARENILSSTSVFDLKTTVVSLSRKLMNFSDSFNGVIGVGMPDDSSALSSIYAFIYQFKYHIFFLIIVVSMFIYFRTKDVGRVWVTALVLIVSIFGCLFFLPKFVPYAFSSLSTHLSKKLTSNILLVRGEQYDKMYIDEEDYMNKDIIDLGSIKLYDLTFSEAREYRNNAKYNPSRYMTDKMVLDSNMGLYLEGTEIKLDLKHFWTMNTYYTEFNSSPDINAYQILSGKHIPSPELISYYNPMLILEDGFVENLNLMLKNYKIQKSVITYPDHFAKDAMIVNSYINSYPFLYILPDVKRILNEDSNIREMAIIQSDFPNEGDVLRLQWLADTDFFDLDPEIANSIWCQTMVDVGFYDVVAGQARRQLLVDKVNSDTYDFLVTVTPDIGLVSDENMIRLTSLYATFSFNNYISRIGHNVYPRYAQVNEFSVDDVLTATILKNSSRFLFYDVDTPSNIQVEKGIAGLLVADLATIILMFISVINSLIIPVVYVGGLLLIIILALLNKNISGAISIVVKLLSLLLVTLILTTVILNSYVLLPYNSNIYIMTAMLGLLLFLLVKCVIHSIKNTQLFRDIGYNSSIEQMKRYSNRIVGNTTNNTYNNNSRYSTESYTDNSVDDYGYRIEDVDEDGRRYDDY